MVSFVSWSIPSPQVVYDASGFLEKNRDPLHLDSIHLLASSKCQLPQIFASKMLSISEMPLVLPYRSNGADSQKLSVATKFKVLYSSRLTKLCHSLDSLFYWSVRILYRLC